MPQPIRKDERIAVHHFPRCLLERPKLAVLIGTVAAEWGYIDGCLVDTYERAISDQMGRDAVAVSVMETLSSLALKLQLIIKVLQMRVPKELCDHFAMNVAPLLRNGSKERGRLLHGDWGTSDDYPNDLILKEASGRLLRYTEKDLRDTLDRITPIRNAANDMVIKTHHAPKRKL
jgi:hypothetical protein